MSKLLPLCFLALLTAASCSKIEKEKRYQGLTTATEGYGNALRWGYYDSAYSYVHPSLRQEDAYPKALDNVRVTTYEVIQPPAIYSEDQEQVEQRVQIEYVLRDEQVVHKLSDLQDWRYDPETKTWWLYSGLPKFLP